MNTAKSYSVLHWRSHNGRINYMTEEGIVFNSKAVIIILVNTFLQYANSSCEFEHHYEVRLEIRNACKILVEEPERKGKFGYLNVDARINNSSKIYNVDKYDRRTVKTQLYIIVF